MELLDRHGDLMTIQLRPDELVLVYGALVEAMEALSPSEFRARIGQTEEQAQVLLAAIRPIITA